jgi:uncharacterized protein (DUF1778 family)
MRDMVGLRLVVTPAERDMIRKAAAIGGWRSMAAFCRAVVLAEAARSDLDWLSRLEKAGAGQDAYHEDTAALDGLEQRPAAREEEE